MAKAHKMTRGATSTTEHVAKEQQELPAGVHCIDKHGNVHATLGASRTEPRYYNIKTLREAWQWGVLPEDRVKVIAEAIAWEVGETD